MFLPVLLATALAAQSANWLDRPLTRWNAAGAAIPAPPTFPETRPALAGRCASVIAAGGAVDALVSSRGWLPFLHLDRRLTRDDVEVVGGMAAAGPNCEPTAFNLFVFVEGRFVGALSPSLMRTSRDGVAGAIRLTSQDTLTAEFARYTPADAECCPSSVVRVSYRINGAGPAAVLEAVETTRVR